ncbi:hypothetical protein WDW86_12290 [Bdellovibrionota bacterium FG-2]
METHQIQIRRFLIPCLFAFSGYCSAADVAGPSPEELSAFVGGVPPEFSEKSEKNNPYAINYFGIFEGPGITQFSNFQPAAEGGLHPDRPVVYRNFMSVARALPDDFAVSGTVYWTCKPLAGEEFQPRDPFLIASHTLNFGDSDLFYHYGDMRVHFGVSQLSRVQDRITGVQTYHTLGYNIQGGRFTIAANGSARVNFYGSHGYGEDVELYFAPLVYYQLKHNIAFNLLFEMAASHMVGESGFSSENAGTDLEPGVNWSVTPTLVLNPYLHLYPFAKIGLDTTSFGVTLSWQLM